MPKMILNHFFFRVSYLIIIFSANINFRALRPFKGAAKIVDYFRQIRFEIHFMVYRFNELKIFNFLNIRNFGI